jgi:hypothetical protein
VAHASRWSLLVAAGVLAGACSRGAEQQQPPAAPAAVPAAAQQQQAVPTAAPAAAQQRQAAPAPDTTSASAPSMELSRETFAYRGTGRDPFLSLLRSGDVRPMPEDVRVTGITFDPRYPQRSVATLQDTTYGRRYTVRVGDVIGRIRVVEIRATQVVAVVEEFGVDRQLVLPIRRRQEDTP